MTQTLLGFLDLPVGSQVPLQTPDRGTISYAQAIAASSLGSVATSIAQVRFVTQAGNDATADGSIALPFLTIAAAMASITDASASKVYAVHVGPGNYTGTFTLKPFVYVIGWGTGQGSYNGTPLAAATQITPVAAQVLDASWAGATVKWGGIVNCALRTALVGDFNAIGSTAPSQFLLKDVLSESAVTFTGSGNLEYATIQDLSLNATVNLTLANMGGSVLSNVVSDFNASLVLTQSAAIQGFHTMNGGVLFGLTMTWTSALQSNLLSLAIEGGWPFATNQVTVTGIGAWLSGPTCEKLTVVSATPAEIQFQQPFPGAVGTLIGCGGLNEILSNIGSDSAVTLHKPPNGTKILFKNQNAFNIALTFADAAGTTGDPSYIGPFGMLFGYFTSGSWCVSVVPGSVQSGTTTLVNGVSPFITADISAQSSIVATLKTFNGAAGTPACNGADRVNGSKATTGGFKVHAINLATGADLATDQGTYDWHVTPGKA